MYRKFIPVSGNMRIITVCWAQLQQLWIHKGIWMTVLQGSNRSGPQLPQSHRDLSRGQLDKTAETEGDHVLWWLHTEALWSLQEREQTTCHLSDPQQWQRAFKKVQACFVSFIAPSSNQIIQFLLLHYWMLSSQYSLNLLIMMLHCHA